MIQLTLALTGRIELDGADGRISGGAIAIAPDTPHSFGGTGLSERESVRQTPGVWLLSTMRTQILPLVLSALARACSPARALAPATSKPPETPETSVPTPGGRTVRYVDIDVEQLIPLVEVDATAARRWAADPANAPYLRPPFRHLLAKVSSDDPASEVAARRKIDGLLARVVAGEDIAKLAVLSDDPGSARNGGAYPGLTTLKFVAEVRHAYEALEPGTFTREPVKSSFGWHVIAKDAVDEASIIESYKYAMAVHAAEKVAVLLRTRLRHTGPEGVAAVLTRSFADALSCECGVLPAVSRLPADAPASAYAASCKELVATARDGKTSRTSLGHVRVATLTDDPPDPAEVEGGECAAESEAEARSRAMMKMIRERLSKESK